MRKQFVYAIDGALAFVQVWMVAHCLGYSKDYARGGVSDSTTRPHKL